jgi:hypothetical protein
MAELVGAVFGIALQYVFWRWAIFRRIWGNSIKAQTASLLVAWLTAGTIWGFTQATDVSFKYDGYALYGLAAFIVAIGVGIRNRTRQINGPDQTATKPSDNHGLDGIFPAGSPVTPPPILPTFNSDVSTPQLVNWIRKFTVGWFWPRESRSEIGVLGRLGRIIHWAGLLASGGLVIGSFGVLLGGGDSAWAIFAALLVVAIFVALSGRGARYVLTDE